MPTRDSLGIPRFSVTATFVLEAASLTPEDEASIVGAIEQRLMEDGVTGEIDIDLVTSRTNRRRLLALSLSMTITTMGYTADTDAATVQSSLSSLSSDPASRSAFEELLRQNGLTARLTLTSVSEPEDRTVSDSSSSKRKGDSSSSSSSPIPIVGGAIAAAGVLIVGSVIFIMYAKKKRRDGLPRATVCVLGTHDNVSSGGNGKGQTTMDHQMVNVLPGKVLGTPFYVGETVKDQGFEDIPMEAGYPAVVPYPYVPSSTPGTTNGNQNRE
jgi:hypothetical protein